MLIEGQQLGDFEILEHLGQGGMGAVFKARQTSLRRLVALKTLKPFVSDDPEYVARFRQEAVAAAALNHPNLVQVYAAGEAEGIQYFAMEYVEGESAQARIGRKGRLDPLEAIAIGSHVAAALEHGWRKAALIHRDIKPDNIFLSSDGEVKLGDLGLAKSAGQTGLTMTGASMGTPHYISPEQAEGMKGVDLRADIYSLGCTLFHLLSGEPPFKGDSAMAVMLKHVSAPTPDLRGLCPECPAELAALVMKMMRKQPAERPQSHAEAGAELRRVYDLLNGNAVPDAVAVTQQQATRHNAAAPGPSAEVAQPKTAPGKSKVPLYAGIGAGLLALAAGAFFLFKPKEAKLTQAELYTYEHTGNPAIAGTPTDGRTGSTKLSDAPVESALSKATKETPFVNSLGMKFAPVPILGGPTGGHRVLFSVWDTRVQDYEVFAKETKREWDPVDFPQGPTHPALMVSWEDAQLFCQWLTTREQIAGKLPAEFGYRLPSDHEWSCAVELGARENAAKLPSEKSGKITDAFPWGRPWPPPAGAGNYAGEELRSALEAGKYGYINDVLAGYRDGFVETSPVGSFAANQFGLFDLGGNARQWCEDWFDKDQKDRVLRGSSWFGNARGDLLSSYRLHAAPSTRVRYAGFRCVLSPATPTPW